MRWISSLKEPTDVFYCWFCLFLFYKNWAHSWSCPKLGVTWWHITATTTITTTWGSTKFCSALSLYPLAWSPPSSKMATIHFLHAMRNFKNLCHISSYLPFCLSEAVPHVRNHTTLPKAHAIFLRKSLDNLWMWCVCACVSFSSESLLTTFVCACVVFLRKSLDNLWICVCVYSAAVENKIK